MKDEKWHALRRVCPAHATPIRSEDNPVAGVDDAILHIPKSQLAPRYAPEDLRTDVWSAGLESWLSHVLDLDLKLQDTASDENEFEAGLGVQSTTTPINLRF